MNDASRYWIVGYGNSQRRDDGCGWHVAARLLRLFGEDRGVTILLLHQLDPVLAEDLQVAEGVIFVDATTEEIPEGVEWRRIRPEGGVFPCWTHHLKAAALMGLIHIVYGRSPSAWLVSVKGQDFGFGEGLSALARKRARRASREIAAFVARKMIDKGKGSIKSYTKAHVGG
ncbi:MAG: hydrogenase maturation protease [Deltaproteobacteria bacterium]|nr:hydrogenase maturation protease [Deltaproteobacteria bacterium]